MRFLAKAAVLATAVALVLNSTNLMAEEAAKFKSDDQKLSYALGASLGSYLDKSLKEQESLGIKLERAVVLQGVQDAYASTSKLNEQEIEAELKAFSARVQSLMEKKNDEEKKVNAEEGDKFRSKFEKEAGVKKSKTGLLYRVKTGEEGQGEALKDSDTLSVHYKGSLVDGSEFDSSYSRGEPAPFRLDGVIPGWTEGLKHIRKGGKIKLVIPPELAYGEAGIPGAIPPNATLVFEIELLDVNPKEKEEKTEQAVEAKPAEAKPAETKQQDSKSEKAK